MADAEKQSPDKSRASTIASVKTGLAFFALAFLVIETLIATLTAKVFTGTDRTLGICGFFLIALLLIGIVTWFMWHRPGVLEGTRPETNPTTLTAPLKAEIKQLREENTSIREENLRLTVEVSNLNATLSQRDSLRSRIFAILGRDSASLMSIFNELGLLTDTKGRAQVESILGNLIREGEVEADTSKPSGSYRLRKK